MVAGDALFSPGELISVSTTGKMQWFTGDENVSFCLFQPRALLYNGCQLPEARRRELEQVVKHYFGVEELTEQILKSGVELDTKYVIHVYLYPYAK